MPSQRIKEIVSEEFKNRDFSGIDKIQREPEPEQPQEQVKEPVSLPEQVQEPVQDIVQKPVPILEPKVKYDYQFHFWGTKQQSKHVEKKAKENKVDMADYLRWLIDSDMRKE